MKDRGIVSVGEIDQYLKNAIFMRDCFINKQWFVFGWALW